MRIVGHRDTGEDAVDAETPSVLDEVDAVRLAVLDVEAPADVGLANPAGDVLEVVVGEVEAGPDWRGRGEVEHLAGGGPPARKREQLGRDGEQRVGLNERTVREPHPQLVGGVDSLDHVAEAEAGDDQRRVGLDVRAHDEDVAGFERLVVGEQSEQHFAKDVDLAGGSVAAVHLHRAVGPGVRSAFGPNGIGGDVGLQPAKQSVGAVEGASRTKQVFVGLPVGGQAALKFAKVAAEGGQQRMGDGAVAGVVAAGDLPVIACELSPQVVAGVGQPEVKVVMGGEGLQQFDFGRRQSGVPEQRQPLGQICGGLLQCGKGFRVSDVRRVGVDLVEQGAPQGRLPLQVGGDITGDIVFPVDEELRPLAGVGGEEPGEAACHRVAPALPQLAFFAGLEVAEVGCQRRCTSPLCSWRR